MTKAEERRAMLKNNVQTTSTTPVVNKAQERRKMLSQNTAQSQTAQQNLKTYNTLKNATQTRSYDEVVKQSQPLPFTNSSGALDPFALTKGIQQQVKYGQADALIGPEARKTMQERIDYNGYGLPAGFNKNDVEAYKILSGKTDDEVRKEVVSGLMGNNPEYDQIQKETKLINRYDSITPVANYTLGDLQLDLNKAYYDYSQNPSEYNKKQIERIEKLIGMYNENSENVGKGGWITKDVASYLPQRVRQIKAGLEGTVVGGSAGAAVGAGAGSVIPGIGTAAGALTGLKLGSKAGYVGGVTKDSYEQMVGAAYRELISLGIDEDVALEISKDTGLWQGIIEGVGAGVDLATLGIGRLFTQGPKTAAQLTTKKVIADALKAYGYNLASEYAEERTQEAIAIKGEKEAFKRSGMVRQTTPEEDEKRKNEAGFGGLKIALVMGSGNVIGNISTNVISQNTINQTNKFYDDYETKIKEDKALTEQQKQEMIADAELGRQKTVNEINNQLAQQNVTPQSPQIEQIQPSNETIPLAQQNQNTADMAQNNANVQNNVQNQSNIEQISQNNVENAQNLQNTVQNMNNVEKKTLMNCIIKNEVR